MPRTAEWQPMQRTIELIKLWYSKLAKGKLSADELAALQTSIKETSTGFRPLTPPGEKLNYSDSSHKPIEAMLDFVLAISQCLSAREFFQLTEVTLAHQAKHIDTTFLRGTELARYLLIIEMGNLCPSDGADIPAPLLAHLNSIAPYFTNEGLMNLTKTLLMYPLSNCRKNYHGLEHLHIPKSLTSEQIAICRTATNRNITSQLSDARPKQPQWLDGPIIEKKPLVIQTMFKQTDGQQNVTHDAPSVS